MERYVLQLQADVYISHLYRSCNYDEKIVGSLMKLGGGGGGGGPVPPQFQS